MPLRKLLRFLAGLLLLLAVALGLTSINHPILRKWVTGAARHFGKGMAATVYTNGQRNEDITVFYTDEPYQYFFSVPTDDSGTMTFFTIDLHEKWIGRQVATAKKDYDLIAGHLFLSTAGKERAPLPDETNGRPFNPQFSSANGQITFRMPPQASTFDSVRIQLP